MESHAREYPSPADLARTGRPGSAARMRRPSSSSILHILGAVVALGFSLTYGLWTARGEVAGPAERSFTLRTMSWVDRRFTTPAYIAQVVTGLILVSLIDWSLLRESWLAISLATLRGDHRAGHDAFGPAHRRQSELADRAGGRRGRRGRVRDVAARARGWGVVVTLLTVVIVV